MKDSFTYIVIGLGGLGSAAAYWLSRKAGREVLGIEQFELGHVRGESQDHSRIIRKTYTPFPMSALRMKPTVRGTSSKRSRASRSW